MSPFIGRFDDIGQDGMSLVRNIISVYQYSDGHVEVLAASVRSFGHFLCSIKYGADIVTAPLKILKQWKENSMFIPDEVWQYNLNNLAAILYQPVSLDKQWSEYNIQHDLTDRGLEKFTSDWNNLIKV